MKVWGRSIFVGLALGGLAASLALNLWLVRQGRIAERHYFLTRLDPIGLGAYPADAPAAAGPRVVFYGDSRVRQWDLPTPPPGGEYLNRGVDGQSSRQALLRYEAHVAPLRPTVVVIQIGVNDLISIRLLERDREAIIADARANIAALVARARADGATVVLTTIFPAADPSLAERLLPSSTGAAIEEVNAFLPTLAGPQVIVFESAGVLADPRGVVRAAYRADMWHLNEAGYAALNAALAPILAELLNP